MEKGGVEVKVKVTQQELEQPYKTKNWVDQASNNNDSRHKICQHHQDKLNQVSRKDDITRTDLKNPKTIKQGSEALSDKHGYVGRYRLNKKRTQSGRSLLNLMTSNILYIL